MNNIIELKKQYNEVLKREKKAQLYIDNPNVSDDTVYGKYMPEYQKIIRQLSRLLNEIGTYTQEEALEGFKF